MTAATAVLAAVFVALIVLGAALAVVTAAHLRLRDRVAELDAEVTHLSRQVFPPPGPPWPPAPPAMRATAPLDRSSR